MRETTTTSTCLLLATLLAAAGCHGGGGGGRMVPLLDPAHRPDVLTETTDFALPPASDGNRFVKGWRFRHLRGGGLLATGAAGGSRLELVNLAARPRTLELSTRILPGGGGEVRIQAAGSTAAVPAAEHLALPLPAALPEGRVAVDLRLPEGVGIVPESLVVVPALPPGKVELDAEEVVQSGFSVVDFVRAVAAESVLVGRFEPPQAPAAGQRFAVRIKRDEGQMVTAFAWRGGWSDRLRGTRRLAIPLGSEPGLVRIRLVAAGEGPAARWRELGIRLSAAPPPAASPPPPAPQLVLVYVLDALRADHLGHLGGDGRATPTLDRLASEGVSFTRHASVAPNTLPSTKSLFTGQYYLTRGRSKLPDDGPATLAEIFTAAGYRTAGFSGNGNLSAGHGTIRGFEHFSRGPARRQFSEKRYNNDAERLHYAVLRWLDERTPDERVFLYLHTIHPHNPYDPPEPFRSALAGAGSGIRGDTRTLLRIKRGRLKVDSSDRRRLRGLYAGGLAYNDARIGPFLEELVRRYPPGEVLVIFTSDHGEELFDHGGILHGHTLYEEMLHVPLIFWWPQRLAPGRVEVATDGMDLHQTLRVLAGVPAAPILGESRTLWDLLRDPGARRGGKAVRFAAAASLKGGIFMARSERYKLIRAPRSGIKWGMGGGIGRSWDPEYVFDLANDPGETDNRAGDPSLEVAWLRSQLTAWVERGQALETGVEVTELDDETVELLKALGYME